MASYPSVQGASSVDLVAELERAITAYAFPPDYYDFRLDKPSPRGSILDVEELIRSGLLSNVPGAVKDALSNVLYWGYARIGFRDIRVRRFREGVSDKQLHEVTRLLPVIKGPGLREIARLKLPEFSGMSFVSKVRMFMEPQNYAVLDQKIATLRDPSLFIVLNDLAFSDSETRIRISGPNESVYEAWCVRCASISQNCYGGRYRAADVERGFFQLAASGREELARRILASL